MVETYNIFDSCALALIKAVVEATRRRGLIRPNSTWYRSCTCCSLGRPIEEEVCIGSYLSLMVFGYVNYTKFRYAHLQFYAVVVLCVCAVITLFYI